ncbi:DNA/RNA-binding domain E.t1.c1-type [Penicillium robsamsonii]|uniref:DNA/RNA-binding domain E.t1.c1-type n=1 Tax=Penicillium robsamsonii TaxID=1792511 RepID=UPI00254935A3|nr:DNA/RNA-binding domain E.t1.c1-type [Penicillium robsamsonii]KAJ5836609.1 DNA/RNA-binding domain E.t1.c1-type [Penicillium robsamsonii]
MGAGCCSATPPISGARPNSTGVPGDDCTMETLSSHGVRVLRSPARTSVGHVDKSRRRNSFRVSREARRLSLSASQLNPDAPQCLIECLADPKESNVPRQEKKLQVAQGFPTRPELQRSHSTPIAVHGQNVDGIQKVPHTVQAQESWHTKNIQLLKEKVGIIEAPTVAQEARPLEMFRQPDTHTITEKQLINEVRGIYTGLVMVEKKCIEIDRQQAQSKAELSQAQWQTLVSLHRTLLYEHHDFFLASQHPSAGPVLRDLAEKYAMPARMWRYGVHSFLELLRQKLPGSMEYMLDFIYLSYSMITLLLESVSYFKETWIECLGDLARYRMAVEELDKKDRELWAGVSRYWYNQDADQSPENGRIQHHLAVLARPDILQQFFHYTKALISVRAFPNALESMTQLVTPWMNVPAQNQTLITSFVTTHGALFMQAPVEEFVSRANVFLATLRKDISRVSRHGQQGVQLTSCNIAAIFQYGSKNGVMETDFTVKLRNPTAEDRLAAMEWASNTTATKPIYPVYSNLSSQLAFRASSLAFHTLIVMLGQIGDPNMYPSVHISMAFMWCLTLNPSAIQRLEPLVPWSLLASYLNTLFRPDTIMSKIEDESFPLLDDSTTQQLPEDFLIRGQAWSRLYYPERFFEGAPTEDNRPSTEEPSTVIPRRHRCLWLGVRIATYTRWMTYDQTRRFTPTQLAEEFSPIAESTAYLYGNPYSLGVETSSVDQEMQEA